MCNSSTQEVAAEKSGGLSCHSYIECLGQTWAMRNFASKDTDRAEGGGKKAEKKIKKIEKSVDKRGKA